MFQNTLYIIFGLPGSGKTTVAEYLMESFAPDSYIQISPDSIRKELFPISQYTKEESWKIWEEAVSRAKKAMGDKKIVFWDAVFGHEHKRKEISSIAKQMRYTPCFLYIKSLSDEIMKNRLTQRVGGPSDADFDTYKKLQEFFQDPEHTENMISIENNGTLEDLWKELKEKLDPLALHAAAMCDE